MATRGAATSAGTRATNGGGVPGASSAELKSKLLADLRKSGVVDSLKVREHCGGCLRDVRTGQRRMAPPVAWRAHGYRPRCRLATLQARLRSQFVLDLQRANQGVLSKPAGDDTLKRRAVNSLVAEYLRLGRYDCTLSVFLPESKVAHTLFSRDDVLQVRSRWPLAPHTCGLRISQHTCGNRGWRAVNPQALQCPIDLHKVAPPRHGRGPCFPCPLPFPSAHMLNRTAIVAALWPADCGWSRGHAVA